MRDGRERSRAQSKSDPAVRRSCHPDASEFEDGCWPVHERKDCARDEHSAGPAGYGLPPEGPLSDLAGKVCGWTAVCMRILILDWEYHRGILHPRVQLRNS